MIAQERIKLTHHTKASKMTLLEALQNRHSVREYASKEISNETLGTLLWAACGVNRPHEGRITAPSAVNAQDVVVYVCTSQGAFRYEALTASLVKVCDKDLRSAVAGRQEFAKDAPLCLVLVSNQSKFNFGKEAGQRLGAIDVGYVSENICLACTALGLATVPRATMDETTLRQELNLKNSEILLINHPVGYPKDKK